MSVALSETWKPVYGFEGLYEVSDAGSVRSVDRIDPAGRRLVGKLLSLRRAGNNHWAVCLYKDRKQRQIQVQVLVLEAFVGPRPEGMLALHWDDDPSNNHLKNLRWGSKSDNAYDSVRNRLHNCTVRTHCPRGHKLGSPNNRKFEASTGRRCCLACSRAYGRLYSAGTKEPYKHAEFQSLADEIYLSLTL